MLNYELDGITISIDRSIIKKIETYCEKQPTYETGGIIIGYYSSDQSSAMICDVTGAPLDSKSGRNSFFRGVNGLNKYLKNLWEEGKYYLGEWHYHPECTSTPSGIDNQQMINISTDKNFTCPEPILIIAGGKVGDFNYSVSVYRNGKRYELSYKRDNFID